MASTKARRSTAVAALAAALALAVGGCLGGKSDKAGGAQDQKPVVLTMANGGGYLGGLEPFAAAVARLSNRTIRIEFKNDWRRRTNSYEPGVIGDVKADRVDLAAMPSRAFDSAGVGSFDALHAPLLVDSYALQQKVLESPLADTMLGGLKPLGVVGLGILPGPMRKPLGVSRLVRPEDYRGKTIANSGARSARETLETLGATASRDPALAGRRIDPSEGIETPFEGIETQVEAINYNHYDKVAKYLTANVNLWPAPQVVFINQHAFAALSETQRDALHVAARRALPATTAFQQDFERELADNICRRGLNFVTASAADLRSLRRAVQPVYDRLDQDPATRAAIDQIQNMRSGAQPAPDGPTCSNASNARSAAGQRTPIDGTYRMHTTADDLRAAGSPPADINVDNYGDFQMVLDRGHFTQKQPRGARAAGTYAVKGDILTLTTRSAAVGEAKAQPVAGEQFTYRWSLYRDQLALMPVAGKISPEPFRAKPWRRIDEVR
jgi:TRAP-type C4-dicarboxylate transport system substrate-binding protein